MSAAREAFRRWSMEIALRHWPEDAPEQWAHLSKEEVVDALARGDWRRSLPRAELTEAMQAAVDQSQESEEEAFRAAVSLGKKLAALRAITNEEEFWKHCAQVCDGAQRTDLEFAMHLAEMEAPEA